MPHTAYSERLSAARDAARAAGLTRFSPGIPCKRGHVAERFTSNKGCAECASPAPAVKPFSPNEVRDNLTLSFAIYKGLDAEARDALHFQLVATVHAFHREKYPDDGPLHRHPYRMGLLREATQYGITLAEAERKFGNK